MKDLNWKVPNQKLPFDLAAFFVFHRQVFVGRFCETPLAADTAALQPISRPFLCFIAGAARLAWSESDFHNSCNNAAVFIERLRNVPRAGGKPGRVRARGLSRARRTPRRITSPTPVCQKIPGESKKN